MLERAGSQLVGIDIKAPVIIRGSYFFYTDSQYSDVE